MTQKSLKNLMMVVVSVSLAIGAMLAAGCTAKEVETPPPETPPPINEPEPPPPEIPPQIIEDITPQEAFALIQDNQDNPDLVIIDLQAPQYFAGGHIENAINLDYSSDNFRDELDKLDRDKTYLIYYTCHCGDIDTKSLYLMKELNFTEVYNISGGIEQWAGAGLPVIHETPPQIIEDITPEEAFALIQDNQDNPDLVIIDVRTPEEFAEEYIEDAINLDYYSETFQDELDTLARDKTYIIYCRSGGRSGNTLDIMAELNFTEVYNISGGFIRWLAEGLPTIQETPPHISESITPQEAFDLIQDNQDNPDFIIIDVRTPGNFAQEHIEDAINIDYGSENFRDELDQLDKDKTYLIYYTCACGGIDSKTLNIMAELNFSEVYKISGGFNRWKADGFPTVD
jgi:rhodanese-related sulfurtransferase